MFLVVAMMSAFAVVASPQCVKPTLATVAEPAITIEVAGKKTKLGAVELAKLKRHTIKTKDHGTDATFEGFAMADVLTAAGVEQGEKLRGKRMTDIS